MHNTKFGVEIKTYNSQLELQKVLWNMGWF